MRTTLMEQRRRFERGLSGADHGDVLSSVLGGFQIRSRMGRMREEFPRQRRQYAGNRGEIAKADRNHDSPGQDPLARLKTDLEALVEARDSGNVYLLQVGHKLLLKPLAVLRKRGVFDWLEILQSSRATYSGNV